MRRIIGLLVGHGAAAALGTSVLLSGVLMTLGDEEQARVRKAVQTVLWPSHRTLSLVEDYTGLWSENRKLRTALAEANLDRDRLAALEEENRRLRHLFEFEETSPLELIPARVVARDAGPLQGRVVIDRGKAHGVENRMTVMVPEGLVGRVERAEDFYSEVELMTARGFAASARIVGKRVNGVVKWDAGRRKLMMYHVPVQAEVAPGDVVLTSDLGGGFADGIRIGRVARVGEDEGGLFKLIELELPSFLWSATEVFVVRRAPESAADTVLVGSPARPEE